MPIKTLINGDPQLSGEENEYIFNAVQTFIARSGRFLVSDCRFGVSPVNYPDPDSLKVADITLQCLSQLIISPLLDSRLGDGVKIGFFGAGTRV